MSYCNVCRRTDPPPRPDGCGPDCITHHTTDLTMTAHRWLPGDPPPYTTDRKGHPLMNVNDYQCLAAETAIYPGAGNPHSFDGLAYTVLGLTGEAGEIANKVKKVLRDHDDLPAAIADARDTLAAELGDVLWYVAMLASQLGYSLEDIARSNLDKLAHRANRGTLTGSGDHR